MKTWAIGLAALACMISTGVLSVPAWAQQPAGKDAQDRLGQIIQANIIATHAYQVQLAGKGEQADNACFAADGLSDADLQGLIAHQQSLLKEKPQAIRAWVEGAKSDFDPAKDLEPILASKLQPAGQKLPVNVLFAYIKEKSPQATDLQARGLASLLQMMLDVDRDADALQGMFALYNGLGLPVFLGQVGIADVSDEDLLAMGKELSGRMCACPFEVSATALQTHGRKMFNWGRRYTGQRDVKVLARELLAEEDVKALIPLIQKMPAQKIAVIGHSYTMGVHWSTPSAFVPIVAEMIRTINPKVEIRQWEGGGLTAERACGRLKFYEQVLAWKPDRVLLVVGGNGKANDDAMKAMVEGFHQAGIEVMAFDRLRLSRPRPTTTATTGAATTGATSGPTPIAASSAPDPIAALQPTVQPPYLHVIEVGPLLDASPDRAKFSALDNIHMTEPYHRLMAKEWLKYLIGARQDKLEAK